MSFLIFLIALSTMILAHELGHFLVAKWKKVKVEEFGLGFPPRIFAKKFGETTYSLNLLPMGGFVRLWGMEGSVKKEKKRSFYRQPKKTQVLILIAGVMMNFLVSIMVFSVAYGIVGVPESLGYIKVVEVVKDSPASEAGIKEDEIILAVKKNSDLVSLSETKKLVKIVKKWAGEEISILVIDPNAADDKVQWLKLVPRKETPEGEGPLGVVITDSKVGKPSLIKRIPLGIWYGTKEGLFWGENIVRGLGVMVIDLFSGKPVAGLVGPVGIYKTSSEILKQSGLLATIHFFAVVSVNLVIVNLLPLPAADGSHLLLLVFEKLRGRPVSKKVKRKISQVGIAIILILFFLILAADIKRFILN